MAATTVRKLKPKETSSEVVVGVRTQFQSGNNASPDRVEKRLNKLTIDQMRLDAEIESDVTLLMESVFSDGIEIQSAITDEEDAEFGQAQEIADFIALATDAQFTARPLESVCKEMGKDAFFNAVKVAEIVLQYLSDARVDGKLVLDRLNPKPNSATAFFTDEFYNVLGLVGAKRAGEVAQSRPIGLTPEEIIPLEKFLVVAFELEDNDPRGLSQARALVEEFCDKRLTRGQWKEWRKTYAIPYKFGTTAKDAKEIPVRNADGSKKLNPDGTVATITAEKGFLNALEGAQGNSVFVAPFEYAINQLEVSGKGDPFKMAIAFNDSAIRKRILGDALMTGAADKDARAARESSKDVADIVKRAYRTAFAGFIEKQIYRLLTVVNFGADKAHLTPKCFLGDTEANDWAGDLTAAKGAGYTFAPEHMPVLDVQFGLPPRDMSLQPEKVEVVDEGN